MSDYPTPYPELAEVLASLPLLVREARRSRRRSQRAAAEQIGVSFSTISRAENGEGLVMANAVAMLRWLDTPAGPPDPPKTTKETEPNA